VVEYFFEMTTLPPIQAAAINAGTTTLFGNSVGT
jgi:hypothetical protein